MLGLEDHPGVPAGSARTEPALPPGCRRLSGTTRLLDVGREPGPRGDRRSPELALAAEGGGRILVARGNALRVHHSGSGVLARSFLLAGEILAGATDPTCERVFLALRTRRPRQDPELGWYLRSEPALVVLDLVAGQIRGLQPAPEELTRVLAFEPERGLLALADVERGVELRSLEGARLARARADLAPVGLSFSPDGTGLEALVEGIPSSKAFLRDRTSWIRERESWSLPGLTPRLPPGDLGAAAPREPDPRGTLAEICSGLPAPQEEPTPRSRAEGPDSSLVVSSPRGDFRARASEEERLLGSLQGDPWPVVELSAREDGSALRAEHLGGTLLEWDLPEVLARLGR